MLSSMLKSEGLIRGRTMAKLSDVIKMSRVCPTFANVRLHLFILTNSVSLGQGVPLRPGLLVWDRLRDGASEHVRK